MVLLASLMHSNVVLNELVEPEFQMSVWFWANCCEHAEAENDTEQKAIYLIHFYNIFYLLLASVATVLFLLNFSIKSFKVLKVLI